ncbi:hypothetical protein Z042_10370 [Chania multitudinisentens RB-25]|uniref:Beta-fimbriae major subunit n=1 Tax=Chania multitudinisentens RB-25 TaxID=1441930 RepID=W0LCK8_9GAMM|nr:DUF1120 domain-containing protein [Chania multitudinisentens]AHG19997.1 hypothetical protein Z042_10370 [Chania multitudinisentens RB-25]
MKKRILCLSVLSALLFTAANAQAAAPTSELKVAGKLGTPTCTIAAPNNGIYNFGSIRASRLKPDAIISLTSIAQSWIITCDGMTYLTITPTDNRSDSMVVTNASFQAPNHYGMGFVNGTGKIGGYRVVMANTSTVDGVQTPLCKGNPGQCSLQVASVFLSKGTQTSWATANNVLKAGSVFKADIRVDADLASTSTMNGVITENTKIDGSVTLNFAFAI